MPRLDREDWNPSRVFRHLVERRPCHYSLDHAWKCEHTCGEHLASDNHGSFDCYNPIGVCGCGFRVNQSEEKVVYPSDPGTCSHCRKKCSQCQDSTFYYAKDAILNSVLCPGHSGERSIKALEINRIAKRILVFRHCFMERKGWEDIQRYSHIPGKRQEMDSGIMRQAWLSYLTKLEERGGLSSVEVEFITAELRGIARTEPPQGHARLHAKYGDFLVAPFGLSFPQNTRPVEVQNSQRSPEAGTPGGAQSQTSGGFSESISDDTHSALGDPGSSTDATITAAYPSPPSIQNHGAVGATMLTELIEVIPQRGRPLHQYGMYAQLDEFGASFVVPPNVQNLEDWVYWVDFHERFIADMRNLR